MLLFSLSTNSNDTYIAEDCLFGLWKPELKSNLFWQPISKTFRRHRQYYAHTWIWASVVSTVSCKAFPAQDISENMGEWAEIVHIDAERSSLNPYGLGRDSITLRGLGDSATVKSLRPSPELGMKTVFNRQEPLSFTQDVTRPPEVIVNEKIFLLANMRNHDKEGKFWPVSCTVLKPELGVPGTYRRLGRTRTTCLGASLEAERTGRTGK